MLNLKNYVVINKIQKAWKADPLAVIAVTTGSIVVASKLLNLEQKHAKKKS